MPSTYSPSLRIEIVGDGEQDGIWGQTTNNNLGSLIEQAITGITSVNVTAGDVTLTSFNGAFDEARSPVINVSGTPGTTRNIIIPNQKKTYLVSNASDSTVGIKTTAGSAATISAGSKSLLVCNGSDVVTPYLESAVITPPFPAGTRVLFQQTSAPTGWTKITTFNDAALRVVSGAASSGGSTGFSTVFSAGGVASNSIALTTAQMPSHSHSASVGDPGHSHSSAFVFGGGGQFMGGSDYSQGSAATSVSGTGISVSIGSAGSGAGHYHTTTMNLQYVDIIIASKD
jgi:hypothetical protein